MGTSPERRDRLKRSEIGLAMRGAATLKKKGSEPSDQDVFLGSSLRSSYSTLDSVTACREKLCSGVGEKEGEASGIVALEGVGDDEMLGRQRGMAGSNWNPDLIKWLFKELSRVLLVINNHVINIIKGHGQL
jgi:hypothetical protein